MIPSLASEVRWDSGVEEGSVIGTDFDPMLSKVISWAPNRIDAANKLARGLEKAHMGGVVTNRQFLISCLRNESFLNGNTTTDFIEREALETKNNLSVNELHQTSTAVALWLAQQNRVSDPVTGFMPANWTNGRMPLQRIKLLFVQDEIEVKYKLNKDNLYEVMGSICEIYHCDSVGIDIEIDSHRFYAHITEAGSEIIINMPFGDVNVSILPRFIEPGNDVPEGGLIAPMPGKVIDVKVKKGSKVKAGDTLVIIEAMKMEHSIKATETGKIAKVMIQLMIKLITVLPFSFLKNNMKSQAVLSKQSPQLGKRHLEVMDELESMLDKGKSFSTMSDLAKQLKISLRTLYEIAPSKEELIVTTVDRVLKKHGKIAMDAMNAHSSPIKKLESFLTVANQAVGPRFERFTLSLSSLNSSKPMVDYHEQYITDLIKNLLDEARLKMRSKKLILRQLHYYWEALVDIFNLRNS
jgi:AcrR family transcriptional regulator